MYGRNHVLKKLTAAGAVAVAASGVMLLGSPANAGVSTRGDDGVLSGNQVLIPISIPVNVCGNSVAVIGIAGAGCKGGASVGGGRRHHHHHHHHYWGS
jgi:hypothetical protein